MVQTESLETLAGACFDGKFSEPARMVELLGALGLSGLTAQYSGFEWETGRPILQVRRLDLRNDGLQDVADRLAAVGAAHGWKVAFYEGRYCYYAPTHGRVHVTGPVP